MRGRSFPRFSVVPSGSGVAEEQKKCGEPTGDQQTLHKKGVQLMR